jgi:hypothetical protein
MQVGLLLLLEDASVYFTMGDGGFRLICYIIARGAEQWTPGPRMALR